jgi:hypothetical protein
MNHTLCMKLYGGTNTRFSVGGLVGSKSIGIALPLVCFSHFVLHFVCQGLLRNCKSFGKFRLSPLHPRKHVLSPLQELQVIRIYQYPWKAILWNAQLQSLCKSDTTNQFKSKRGKQYGKRSSWMDSYPSLQEAAITTHYTSIVPKAVWKTNPSCKVGLLGGRHTDWLCLVILNPLITQPIK